MSGNRVEELEAKVRQLQATVDGLTDELMETKERLHVLEEEVDPDLNMDIIEGRPTKTPETQTNGSGGSAEPSPEAPENQRAVDEAVEAADGDKSEESEENDEADSTDDIIVA
jgi:FtsZ-binding cell division protein ZapB